MLKSAVAIVLVCLTLVALAPVVEAHLAGTINGIHYFSILCVDEISGIPGTALGSDPSKPASVVCRVHATRIEILCLNSQGHAVARAAAVNITVSATSPIDDADITDKKKGTAVKELEVSDVPFLDSEFCTSATWQPVAVLVTNHQVTVEVNQCTDSSCGTVVTTSREIQDCEIPSEFTVENLPPKGTLYICVPVLREHLR